MLNIAQFSGRIQSFHDRLSRLPDSYHHYSRIGRADLTLNPTQFYYFAQLKIQANFKTHRVDLRRQLRYMKDQDTGPARSGRTLRRVFRQLESRDLIRRVGRRYIDVHPNRRQKEIRLDMLYLVRDTIDARIARLFMILAFWPKGRSLDDLTVETIRSLTGGDQHVAHALHRWLLRAAPGLSRKAIRRRIFFADRPAWWLYGPCRRPDVGYWLGWTSPYDLGANYENDRYGPAPYGSDSDPENYPGAAPGPPVEAEIPPEGPGPIGQNHKRTPEPSPRITKDRIHAVERLAEILAKVRPESRPTRTGGVSSLNDCSAASRSVQPRHLDLRRNRPPPEPPPRPPPWWNHSTMGPYLPT